MSSDTVLAYKFLESVLVFKDLLFVLACQNQSFAAALSVSVVLVIEVFYLILFDDLDDVVFESQRGDAFRVYTFLVLFFIVSCLYFFEP